METKSVTMKWNHYNNIYHDNSIIIIIQYFYCTCFDAKFVQLFYNFLIQQWTHRWRKMRHVDSSTCVTHNNSTQSDSFIHMFHTSTQRKSWVFSSQRDLSHIRAETNALYCQKVRWFTIIYILKLHIAVLSFSIQMMQ